MKLRTLICFLTCLGLLGCSVSEPFYTRIELPKDLNESTQRSFAGQVFASLRTQNFFTEINRKFPNVTQQKLDLIDMGLDVVVTSSGRSCFISIGVKNVRGFPEAKGVVDFGIQYAKEELERILKLQKHRGSNGA